MFDNAKNLLIWIPISIYLPRFIFQNISFKQNLVLKFNRNLTIAFSLLAFVIMLYYSKCIFNHFIDREAYKEVIFWLNIALPLMMSLVTSAIQCNLL